MSFELGLAVQGKLGDFIEGEIHAIERGAMDAAYRMEGRGKRALRGDVERGGLGPKLAKTWRARVFPSRALSMEPKVRFDNKAAVIINAFETGETIKSGAGHYLPIPTADFLSSISARARSQNRKNLIKLAESRFGRLRLIPVKGKKIGLLVADGLQKSRSKRGGYRTASDTARRTGRTEDVVLFVLVPQARLKKRLNYKAIERDLAADWSAFLARGIAASLENGRVD
ncbi:hypothetical protein DES40_1722 [Litorimonas taeanensis]|uniref:Uncharacterized protein n=2 Tax=Litorimonas taeanensis TaxID=568099 RepID=A0A420WD85_9PROT|nr:hypothetical protein DES40_1722 [Litorimonas taeanensis]